MTRGYSARRKSVQRLDRLVSLKQLAELWSCDRSTVRRRLEAVGIKPIVFNDSRTGLKRYRLSEIESYLARCQASSEESLL